MQSLYTSLIQSMAVIIGELIAVGTMIISPLICMVQAWIVGRVQKLESKKLAAFILLVR
jgi:hypothetical protein